jgi:hypothetical protein
MAHPSKLPARRRRARLGVVGVGLIGALWLTGACKKQSAAPAPPAAPAAAAGGTAKVVVTNQGAITLNDQALTLDQLKAALNNPAARPSAIQYQRIDPDTDPTPEAAPIVHGVLTTIMDTKIPVSLIR